MKKNNLTIILIVFIILLCIINIHLLLKKNNLTNKLYDENSKNLYSKLFQEVTEKSNEYFFLNQLKEENIPIYEFKKLINQYKFLIVLKSFDCWNCLNQEIAILNELQKNSYPVIGLYLDEGLTINKFIEIHNAEFPLLEINNYPQWMSLKQKHSPIIFCLDKNMNILDCYIPLPGDLKRRNAFYLKLIKHLKINFDMTKLL